MKHFMFVFLLVLTPIALHAAPARTVDLALATDPADGTQLVASWTTPQPGSGCTLSSYDLRISSRSVGGRTWSRSIPVSGEPLPGSPGTPATMTITGLNPSTRYFIGLQSTTDSCGSSPLSNSPYATTSTAVAPQFKMATLSWSMPTNWIHPESGNNYQLDGVKIYYGTTPGGPYDNVVDAGFTTQHVIEGLDPNVVHYFVATGVGYNLDTLEPYETPYSEEVFK